MRAEKGFSNLVLVLVAALLLGSVAFISISPINLMAASPASYERPQNISFSISFEEPQFKIVEGYDLIEMSRCGSFASSPGAPTVPKRTVTILLPPGGDVSSITVTPAGSKSIEKRLYLYPGQRPVPISDESEPEFTLPDPEFYGSSNPYPGELRGPQPLGIQSTSILPKLHQLDFVTSYRGYRIAVLTLFPVTYTPAERGAIFHPQLKVEVEVGEAADVLAFRPTADVEEWVRANVVNPELMSLYESSGDGSVVTFSGPSSDAEYLIITRSMFVNNLLSLANQKRSRGMEVKIVTVDNIVENNLYPGRDIPEQIRNCIRDHHENHGTKWVLLAGDSDYDDLGNKERPNYVLDEDWEVPVRYVWNPNSGDDYDATGHNADWRPTDLYFAGLDGSWDADNDNRFGERPGDSVREEADWFADVYVGRFSARDESTMQAIVDKTIAYEQDPPGEFGNVCFFGAYLWNNYADGKTLKRHIRDSYDLEDGIARSYEYYYQDNTLSYSNFIDAINTHNPTVVNAAAHGSPFGMSIDGTGDKFVDMDTPAGITNDFFMYAMSCLTNAFDIEGISISEAMLRKPNGGAVGYVGGTRVEWGWTGREFFLTYGSSGQDVKFSEWIFQNKEYRQGAALYKSKVDYLTSGWYQDLESPEERCNLFVTMLLGDPELSIISIYTPPQPYAVRTSITPKKNSGTILTTFTYTVVVWNMGASDDTYNLTVSDSAGWDLTISPQTVMVPAGFMGTAELSVITPIIGEDNITIVATSQGDGTVSASDTCAALALSEWKGVLPPSDDAFVDNMFPDLNHGSDVDLIVGSDLSKLYRTFLKFDLSSAPSDVIIGVALLNLYVDASYYGMPCEVREVENDNWSEDTLTWNNQPDNGNLLDISTVGERGTWTSWNVTSWVKNQFTDDNTVSFRIAGGGWNTYAILLSKEWGGGKAPYLEVFYMGTSASISPDYQSGLPGTTLNYTVVVVNPNEVDDIYDLTVEDDAGWSPTVEPTSLTIPAWEGRIATLSVTIPSGVAFSTKDNITVTAASQTDPTVSDNASCIARAIPEDAFTLDLLAGWNQVGFTGVGEEDTLDDLFAGETFYVWAWDAVGETYVSPSSTVPVDESVGYWICVGHDMTIWTSGVPPSNCTIDLVGGKWNLVHFPVTNANTTPANLFTSHTYNIWKWDAVNKYYVSPSSTAPVEPGVGYWIWIDQDMTVTVPL